MAILEGIGLGLGFIGSGLNIWQQSSANRQNIAAQRDINRQNIDWAREQTNLQRQWALEDWNRTNQYNSPLQQMQRLREAGLNPHLVYGSGAQNTAQMVRNTQAATPNLTAPRMAPIEIPDLAGIISQYQDLKARGQQTDNLKLQNELMLKQSLMYDADYLGKILRNEKLGLDNTLAKELKDLKIEEMRLKNAYSLHNTDKLLAEIDKTRTETSFISPNFNLKLQELRLKQAKTSAEVENITADTMRKLWENNVKNPVVLKKLNAELEHLQKTNQLKQFEINLRAAGLNPNDPAYMRILVQIGLELAKKFGVNIDNADPAKAADPLKTLHQSPLKYRLK